MSDQIAYTQLQQMLPVLTEIPFVITDMTIANGSVELIGAVSVPNQPGPDRSPALTPVRITLCPSPQKAWRIVDIAVQPEGVFETHSVRRR
jgi:hypothetical protein